jgi:adenylate cyclase
VEIQRELAEHNAEMPENRKMKFRIGINLGDVIAEGKRIYGDGVNIAARLEGLADVGGICISGTVYDAIEIKIGLEYEFLGEQEVKNIDKPIRAYRVLSYPGAAAHRVVKAKKAEGKKWRKLTTAAVAVITVAAVAAIVWNSYLRPPVIEKASIEKMAFTLPDKPSIAVLPFNNMSGDPEQEYLGDGFTEQIIANLSMIPNLFVIARNSAFSFKGKAVKVQQVAEELGVQYILEGSVQKAVEKVRITAQLIDAITGRHLWAERYDRELKDIFSLQDEITLKIISAVGAEMTSGERTRIISKGTDNVEAYLKVLQGFEHWYRQGIEANLQARKLAEEAIALDPEFPDAYCLLAGTHFIEVFLGTTKSPEQSKMESIRLYQKALAIDEYNSLANGGLAFVYSLQRQYEKAIAQGRRCTELNPGKANPYIASAYLYSGRYEEAILAYNKTIRLDPKGPPHYFLFLGHAYRCLKRYEEAIEEYQKALNREPNHLFSHIHLAATYGLSGNIEMAHAEAEAVLRINPDFSLNIFAKNMPFKDQNCLDRIIEGMHIAGLPD